MKTFNDGINDAIDLLSSYTFVFNGPHSLDMECSATKLVPCNGPTAFAQIYIEALKKRRRPEGTYQEGLEAAIDTLSHNQVTRRGGLIEAKAPPQYMSLYISRLQGCM